jgi:hypothetical protein
VRGNGAELQPRSARGFTWGEAFADEVLGSALDMEVDFGVDLRLKSLATKD